jgi:sortase A
VTWARSLSTVERARNSNSSASRAVGHGRRHPAPDLSLWAPERISAWRRTSNEPAPPPLAVLRIRKIRLEVAVLPGTDEFTLNRAVGHIDDTALPGADGNSGIAGHRDGFFRGLKDIGPEDVIELETLRGKEVYRVERIWIVDPEDVSVLDPTPTRSLTLVTCYPFYHIGPAPQRYIVRAVRDDKAAAVDRSIEQAPVLVRGRSIVGSAQRRRSDDHGN